MLQAIPFDAVTHEEQMRAARQQGLRRAHQEGVVLLGRQPSHRADHVRGLGNAESAPDLGASVAIRAESVQAHAVLDDQQLVGRDIPRRLQRLRGRACDRDISVRDSRRRPRQHLRAAR